MFDIGWAELLVIGVVALIIVGPKELPMMFRKLGQFVGRMRGMARDFQRAMDQAADDSGVKDLGEDLKKATDVGDMGLSKVTSPMKDYAQSWAPGFDKDGKKIPEKTQSGAAAKAAEGSETAKLAAKRAADKATAAAKTAEAPAKSEAAKPAAKKPAAKKPAAKSAAAKKPAAKKPAAKKKPASKGPAS